MFLENLQAFAFRFPFRRREPFLLRGFGSAFARQRILFGSVLSLDTFGVRLFGAPASVDPGLPAQTSSVIKPTSETGIGDMLSPRGVGATLHSSHTFVRCCLPSSRVIEQFVVSEHAAKPGAYGRVSTVEEQHDRGTTLRIRDEMHCRVEWQPCGPQPAIDR